MEFTAKTVAEATELGLKELGITEAEAEIVVKEQPTKGLFGKLKGKAVVEITKKLNENEQNQKRTLDFLQKLLNYLDINAKATYSTIDEKEVITLIAESSSSIIGYRGEVLDAIQTLVGAVHNIGNKEYKKVVVDCENYRDRREETLVKLAHKLEEKATEMRREVHLEPMSPFERRIIHTTLAESSTVTTKSEGKEPNRFVVIVPNDLDEFSRPYNAGRNNDKGGKRDNRGKDNKRHGKASKGGYKSYGDKKSQKSSYGEVKKKSPSIFGTYLGNSLKDKEN